MSNKYRNALAEKASRMTNEQFSVVVDAYYETSTEPEEAKRRFVHELENLRMLREGPNPIAQMGRGILDVYQGGRDLLGKANLPGGYTPEQSDKVRGEVDMYEADMKGSGDWMRTVGQAVATSPLAMVPGAASVNMLPRVAAGMAAGGTAGGILYEQDGMDRLENAAFGTAAGGVLNAAAPALIRMGGKVFGVAKETLRRAGNWIDDSKLLGSIDDVLRATLDESGLGDLGEAVFAKMRQEAKNSIKATGSFDADALVRKAKIQAAGFADDAGPTTGQMTRDPRVMGKEYNISRIDDEVGEPLATRFANQRAKAKEILSGFQRSVFGEQADAVTPYSAVKRIGGMARRRAGEWQGRVSEMYNKVPGGVTLSRESLRSRTWQLMEDMGDDLHSGVKKRIMDAIDDDSKAFTFDVFEQIDKQITKRMGGSDSKAMRGNAGELKEAMLGVLDDSEQAVAEGARGAYRAAKKAAQERFEAIGDPRKLLGQLASGGADEKIYERVLKGSTVDEVQALVEFLDEPTRKWFRASVLNDILDQAIGGTTGSSTMVGDYSQAAFNRAMNKIGREKMKVIFGDTAEQMKLFGEATEYLFSQPAGTSANFSNSGNTNVNFVQRLYKGLIEESHPGRAYSAIAGTKKIDPKHAAMQEISDIAMSGGNVKALPLLKTPGILPKAAYTPGQGWSNKVGGDSLEGLKYLAPGGGIMGVGNNRSSIESLPRKNVR